MGDTEWKHIEWTDTLHGFEYEGEVKDEMPDGFGRAWWPDGTAYRGLFSKGIPDGEGEFFMGDGSRFKGLFRNRRPIGEGILVQGGKRFRAVYDNDGDFRNSDTQPIKQEELGEHVIASESIIPTSCVMKGGLGIEVGDFSHIKSLDGKLAVACPFRANRRLLNAEHLQGKIAVVQRGDCSLSRKLRYVQDAGALAMVVVGTDNLEKFSHMLQVIEGPLEDDDDPGDSPPEELVVRIPVLYVLSKHETELVDGALCRIMFGERTPRTPLSWKLGAMAIPSQTVYSDNSEQSLNELLENFLQARKQERLEMRMSQDRNPKPAATSNVTWSTSVPLPALDGDEDEAPHRTASNVTMHFTPRTRQALPTENEKLEDFLALPALVFRELLAGSCGSMTFTASEAMFPTPRTPAILGLNVAKESIDKEPSESTRASDAVRGNEQELAMDWSQERPSSSNPKRTEKKGAWGKGIVDWWQSLRKG